MSIQIEISKAFELDRSDADVIRELESICNVYRLTPEQLKMKWQAFALSSNCDLKPTVPYVAIMKKALQREFERGLKTRRTVKGKIATKRSGPSGINFSDYGLDLDNNSQDDAVENFMTNLLGGGGLATANVPKTTTTARQVRQALPLATTQSNSSLLDTQMSSISSQFINRRSAHVLEGQHNGHLPDPSTAEQNDVDMDLVESEFTFSHIQPSVKPYRYMHEKLKERADGLDERIDFIGSLLENEYDIEAFGNPTKPGQEAIYAYGLIRSDTSEGKLNEKSILLQTSRGLGMGRTVPLDLSKVDSYTFFPGQIIGVKGTNHNGNSFIVEEILLPHAPEKTTFEIKENKTLDMIVSAGPFTLDDDLSFRPLEELLLKCSEQKPDVILLMGPFLSIHHPKISSASIDTLPEQIFRDQVINRLEQLLDEACFKTNVLLMPHANDIIQYFPLFPQPPMNHLNIKHNRIHLLSNPSSILLNGHSISIANIDTLFRLGKEEICKNPAQADRFTRLSQHILQQHTYYPLVPHALGDSIDAGSIVNLHVGATPDLLILPSQFKHFAKEVDGAICINPGYLCKHQAGGTYSRVILYPTQNVQERIRVDLVKL